VPLPPENQSPGIATLNAEVTAKPARESAGQDAGLYGRRDARHYAEQIPFPARPRRDQRSDFGVDNRFDNEAVGQ